MYWTTLLRFVTFLAWTRMSLQASTAYNPYYSAGVVEFRPSNASDPEIRVLDNLKGYLNILDSEEAKNLDIIVLSEATLSNHDEATFVPNPANGLEVLCDTNSDLYHTVLVQLSCAAKKLSTYILINVYEKEWCNTVSEDTRPCSDSGLNIFNTNVVFDRNGAVISRYRKVNLYGENINTTLIPEIGWFDTDFGVRFGHFICFDILFYEPAQSLVVDKGINNFLFSSMWFSHLPFLTSLQVHQAWSYANNVNLLAAGASAPQVGSTGTGIYNGRNGIIVAKINQGIGERKIYVAQVPKNPTFSKLHLSESSEDLVRSPALNLTTLLDLEDLENYETVLLDLNSKSGLKQKLCYSNSSFCCHFNLKWRNLKLGALGKHYHYRVGIHDGFHSKEGKTNQIKNCAVFSCIGGDIMDCGKLSDTDQDVIFENILITVTFPKAERFLIMPNNLNANLMPLPVNHFEWEETVNKNSVKVRYELHTTTPNIMAFSIYGNYYDSFVDNIPEK